MIITINRNITRTAIDLTEYACGFDTKVISPNDVHIIVRRAGLGILHCEPFFANMGCGEFIGPKKRFIRVQPPGIKYCAFTRDDFGRIVFLWDSKFLEATPGRWNGELFVCDKLVGVLKFQVGSQFRNLGVECIEDDQCPIPSACPPTHC